MNPTKRPTIYHFVVHVHEQCWTLGKLANTLSCPLRGNDDDVIIVVGLPAHNNDGVAILLAVLQAAAAASEPLKLSFPRLVSRPWAADEYLAEVMNMFASSPESMAQIIQNSVDLQRVFAEFVKTSEHRVCATVVHNLRAAKHRFESLQKPLGRMCLNFPAVVKTALHCHATRTDKSGVRAGSWLQWLSTEKCLMAAMMADAADQAMLLTRVLDNEDMDPAALNAEVNAFVTTIETLFGEQRKCLTLVGYTQAMLLLLSRPLVWHVGSKLCSVGQHDGVPAAVIERCLAHMRSWIVLARAAVEAEFPSFEVAQASGNMA